MQSLNNIYETNWLNIIFILAVTLVLQNYYWFIMREILPYQIVRKEVV